MTIKEYYLEAIKNNHVMLKLLIDFLVREKKTVSMSDDATVLDLYFKPKNRDKMNKPLKEYMQQKEG
jgi:hypothetical protein